MKLSGIIGSFVHLIRHGDEYSGVCPFHKERTPSFYVVDNKDFFHCFGCGAHSDAVGFFMRYENIDYFHAVERVLEFAYLANDEQAVKIMKRRLAGLPADDGVAWVVEDNRRKAALQMLG